MEKRIISEHNNPRLTPKGAEILSDEPIQMPLGMSRPETLAEQVQRLVRGSVSEYARLHDQETFAESEDFDCDDDYDPTTPYETFFDPYLNRDVSMQEMHDNGARYKEEFIKNTKRDQKQSDIEDMLKSKPKPEKQKKSARADSDEDTSSASTADKKT